MNDTDRKRLSAFCFAGADIEFTDDGHDDDADDDRDLAVVRRAGTAGSQTEIMGKGSAEQETHDGESTVRIAFTGKDQLAEGATAQQYAGKTDQEHTESRRTLP